MKILKIILENFKGFRHAEYDFADRTIVKGKNGSGKSTIASAWFWLCCDKSYDLASNPAIRPNDAIDEVVTSVTAELDMDGKPVEIQKSQKLKRSKSGTVALTNSYMVNSVPKSEKDFKAYLSDLGVDFEKFLPCSHPNVMLAGINNKKERTALRNLLFEMASDITDEQVAANDPELSDIADLLANYKADEIEAMQNATLRKIRENYGKEGEILRAKIEGLESAKVEVDADEIRKKIQGTDKEIEALDKRADALSKQVTEISDFRSKLMEKEFELNELKSKAGEEQRKVIGKLEQDIYMTDVRIRDAESEIKMAIRDHDESNKLLKQFTENLQKNEETFGRIKNSRFDASQAVCPTCGQQLRGDSLKQAEENFDKENRFRIGRFKEAITMQKTKIRSFKDEIRKISADMDIKRSDLENLKNHKKELQSELTMKSAEPEVDISGTDEYKKLMAEVENINNEINIRNAEAIRQELQEIKDAKEAIFRRRQDFSIELGKEQTNKDIDKRIDNLRDAQRNYEQQKADAEMILDQLKTLNMKKNELLQESVNSHFNLVDFVLFTTLKNGEVKDACIPTINGKRFGESMNNALEVLAKIDVMDSIQRFYGLDYPIILDNAECLDSESMKQIKTDHQLIMFCVSDDKELVFERGE